MERSFWGEIYLARFWAIFIVETFSNHVFYWEHNGHSFFFRSAKFFLNIFLLKCLQIRRAEYLIGGYFPGFREEVWVKKRVLDPRRQSTFWGIDAYSTRVIIKHIPSQSPFPCLRVAVSNCRNLCFWSAWHIMLTFSNFLFYDERLEWWWWTRMTYRKTFSEVVKTFFNGWRIFLLNYELTMKKKERKQIKETNKWVLVLFLFFKKSYRNS